MQLKENILFDNPKLPLRKYILVTVAIVLLLVLALRVQKNRINQDVLNAFVVIDEELVKSTANFIEKTEKIYKIFDAEMEKSPIRVKEFRKMAYHAKGMADRLHYDIQELKVEIVRACDGKNAQSLIPIEWYIGEKGEEKTTFDIDANLIIAKSNVTIPSKLMFTEGKGKELKEKIEKFKDYGLNFYDASLKKYIANLLNTELSPTKNDTWELHHFYRFPMIAVIANLSKMQNDIRNAEAEIVNFLLTEIYSTDTRVNKLETVVQAKSRYVTKGDVFEARILLAAYDSLQKPRILIGPFHKKDWNYELIGEGDTLAYDRYGRAIYKAPATTVGIFTLQGLLQMTDDYGIRNFPFSYEYQVVDYKVP